MTDNKAVIKQSDMSEDMQQEAVECGTQAIEKYTIEKKSLTYATANGDFGHVRTTSDRSARKAKTLVLADAPS